ncbi:hypothetical protein [Pedobacter nyackensis]|uniref:Uncharacterized protein n=1 Tax=Pedobacter nyackensis TaxID=475255 RepID=A0A1W2A0Q1_9SPHI|nr:hypothetical protein [Pedobacter nyackensis]SMC54220.1 hypothetical protein SAMN04488101_101228 [Pedobacter nyackensis]
MPNTNCLSGPAFSVIGDAYFSGTTVSFQVAFDSPEDASSVLAYEWSLDDTLMIDQNNGQFSGQLTCGEHTIGARILSTTGWSGIKSLEFATCRTATELLFYGVDTINEGASTTYYIFQLYSDGTSKDVTVEYIFTTTPGGSFNGNVFTADTDLSGYENYEVTINATKNAEVPLTKQVTVINTTPVVQTSLEIVGPGNINEGGTASYIVLATYSNGSEQNLTSSYVFSSSEGIFSGNTLIIPSNTTLGDSRTAMIYASQSGIPVLSKQITINDVSVSSGVLVVDLYGNSSFNVIGLIDNAEVAGSHVAAYTGHNIMPSTAIPSDALILASGFNSPTWRFEFNIEKLVTDYPQTQNFVFYIKGRSNAESILNGAFSVKTSDGVMTLGSDNGVLMPGVLGGTNHVPLTNVSTKIFAGANGSYDESDLNTILKFTYNVLGDSISYTTYEEPIVIADFDFMAVRYHWLTGSGADLDILAGLENNGTPFDQLYVGYGGPSATIPINTIPPSDAYLWWGLDNTGQQGYEGVLIGIRKFIDAFPNSPNIVEVGLYAVWFGIPATGDFSVELVTYKGGEMSLVGNNFENVGGVEVSSNTVNMNTLIRKTNPSPSTYFKVGTIKYNKTTATATIQIN